LIVFGDRSIAPRKARNRSAGSTGLPSSPSKVQDSAPEFGITSRCTRIETSVSVMDSGR